ncbi:MAG: acylphosphatase [Butyrivibrio sp.]|nr:acylphosphatase [Butyrivibrio sp.]
MEKRYRLRFYGMVQGVGFRYTAYHSANMFRLTGYVKNEYDGSVTCEVQGREEDIDQFLVSIGRGRFIDIERIDKTALPLDEGERSFEVRH